MEPTSIGGAWTFTPAVHRDDRGCFLEWFRAGELSGPLGHWPRTAQGNCSVSRRGVIRGIHFASVPPGQAKYVTCVAGAVLDVIVDVRAGSPTYGRWEAVRLDDQDRRAVYLSEGLGHAFTALTDRATVIYLCSAPYAPGREHGVHPLDPDIGIGWPAGVEPVLSPKDAAAPTLAEARRAGLLPDYAECEAYLDGLRKAAGAQPLRPGQHHDEQSRDDEQRAEPGQHVGALVQDHDARGEDGDVAEGVERVGDAQRYPGQRGQPRDRGDAEDQQPEQHPRRGGGAKRQRPAVVGGAGRCDLHAVLEHHLAGSRRGDGEQQQRDVRDRQLAPPWCRCRGGHGRTCVLAERGIRIG
jgi:dTDP-4-dehydrorhamnose 3,5-epimerase